METADAARGVLMYLILPLWLLAGFADYLCHRAARIEASSGVKESLLHLLQLVEMALPVTAAILFEVNAVVVGVMIFFLIAHAITAHWDVSYASRVRGIPPFEQHVHGVLEVLPLAAFLFVLVLNWPSAMTVGAGALRFKDEPILVPYLLMIFLPALLLNVLPFAEEFLRTRRGARTFLPKPSGRH